MKRKTVAYLTPDLKVKLEIDLWSGINHIFRKHKINLLTFVGDQISHTSPETNAKTIIYGLINENTLHQIDGVIIWGSGLFTYAEKQEIDTFSQRFANKPLITMHVQIDHHPYVIHDNKVGIKELIKHLVVVHRCHKIAFLRGPAEHVMAQMRYESYLESLKEAGLTFDEKLIGNFSSWAKKSGTQFVEQLLNERHLRPQIDFDAIVCSNTRQAIGVIQQLSARGYRVPGDVSVTGFNDDREAQLLTPSVTTADPHQYETGIKAGELMIQRLAGEKIEEVTVISPRVIFRDSCGCLDQTITDLLEKDKTCIKHKVVTDVEQEKDQIVKRIMKTLLKSGILADRLDLAEKMVSCLIHNLKQQTEDAFYFLIKDIIRDLIQAGSHSSDLQSVIYEITLEISSITKNKEILSSLTKLTHQILVIIYQYDFKYCNYVKLKSEELNRLIINVGHQLVSNFEPSKLVEVLTTNFPHVGIDYFALYLYENRQKPLDKVTLFFSSKGYPSGTKNRLQQGIPFEDILKEEYLPAKDNYSLLFMPLLYQTEQLGFIVFDTGHTPVKAYQNFQFQIASNLKGSFLIEERTKLLHEIQEKNIDLNNALNTLWGEMELAKRIQTSILPKDTHVPGYRIATCMRAANLVGGDFYDILKSADNHYWINIGDVTGHGVTAGLIMLMLQTTLLSLIRSHPGIGPAELICQSNEIIYYNLQSRLMVDHFITTCFTKLDPEGNGRFAGAHLDILIYRSETKRVERIVTDGIWLGIVPDIREHTSEGTFKLGQGDLLFLYTDGVVEIANNKHEQYEMGRLVRFLERNGDKPPETVAGLLVKELEAFRDVQKDDFTFLVIKKE